MCAERPKQSPLESFIRSPPIAARRSRHTRRRTAWCRCSPWLGWVQTDLSRRLLGGGVSALKEAHETWGNVTMGARDRQSSPSEPSEITGEVGVVLAGHVE